MKKRRRSSSSQSPSSGALPLPFVESRGGALYIRVRLAPRSSRDKVDGVSAGALKIRLTAPPVEGEANKSLIRFLSGLTGLSKSSFSITPASLKSKDKTIKVVGASEAELCAALGKDLPAKDAKQLKTPLKS